MTTPWHDEWKAAGYRAFEDGFLKKPGDDMYVGSWQKCVRDVHGKRYFISINLWQWPDGRRSAEMKLYVNENKDGDGFHLTRSVTTIEDAETFAARIWAVYGFHYYERNGE